MKAYFPLSKLSLCDVSFSDKDKKHTSLGSFLSAPQMHGDRIRLIYTEGDVCRPNVKIRTIISLKCKPGSSSFQLHRTILFKINCHSLKDV